MRYNTLSPSEIHTTIHRLQMRIMERFPGSGLSQVCDRLLTISEQTADIIQRIERPIYSLRISLIALVAVVIGITGFSITDIHFKTDAMTISDMVQMAESGISGLLVIGAGLLSLFSIEIRQKRNRVITAINRLRCLAHIIDAHQLTKDPYGSTPSSSKTEHSPVRELSLFELGRYLDYCSEMLSLTSKVAFLYIQRFPDPMANEAVNDLENLITGLSRNIWQKLVILQMQTRGQP